MVDEGGRAVLDPTERHSRRKLRRRAFLAAAGGVTAGGLTIGTAAVMSGGTGNGREPGGSPPEGEATAAAEEAGTGPIADPVRRAAHLLRRAGFGGTPGEIAEFASLTPEEAADRLVDFEETDNAALEQRITRANFNLTRLRGGDGRPGMASDMRAWWLTRMAYTSRPLEERMTLIWHGLLTSELGKLGIPRTKFMLIQNELFRRMALPRYDDLLKAISRDPAMMVYLDTIQSSAAHPSENYARELMELFSMGVGNYTEQDVREAARAFTGWRLTAPPRVQLPEGASEAERRAAQDAAAEAYEPEFVIQPRLQDRGMKTFLGKTGPFGGDEIIDIIMSHDAPSRFIPVRLFREFAHANPGPETVTWLAEVWNGSGHDIREVVRAILKSAEFNSEAAYRAKIKSPVEFVVGAVRGLELETDFRATLRFWGPMGQTLFQPPNVAGWPGGPAWLASATFFARLNFLDAFLFPRGRPLRIEALLAREDAAGMVDEALRRLVDGVMSDGARAALVAHAESIRDPVERAATVAYLVLASPEYQLA